MGGWMGGMVSTKIVTNCTHEVSGAKRRKESLSLRYNVRDISMITDGSVISHFGHRSYR